MSLTPLRLVFCGTPAYAVPTLRALVAAGHDVVLAVSQPDKPVGRAGIVAATPVKVAAAELGIAVVQPATLKRNEELHAELRAAAPDCIVVVAYGRILPQWMLDLPRLGCVNAHGSLLPRWRGAAPIQWAIASGDAETGVTTMQMDAGLDTGAMLLRRSVPIGAETTSPQLFEELARVSASLVCETLEGLVSREIVAESQDGSAATLAPLLTREDGLIDWSRSAAEIDQRFRGFQPWPGAFTSLRGKKLIVHALRVEHETGLQGTSAASEPGVLFAALDGWFVGCGGRTLVRLHEVQLEGKKRMDVGEFMRGFQVKSGEVLGA